MWTTAITILLIIFAEAFSRGDKRTYETDEEDDFRPRIKNNEALQVLERL